MTDGPVNSAPQPEQILVAVAWPYASGPRHLGHAAGAYVPLKEMYPDQQPSSCGT